MNKESTGTCRKPYQREQTPCDATCGHIGQETEVSDAVEPTAGQVLLTGQDRIPHPEPLQDWSIFIAHGRTFLGFRRGNAWDLAYELQVQMQATPQGPAIGYLVLPVLMLASVTGLLMDPGACPIVIPCDTLSRNERTMLARGVANAEQLRTQMRAAESGIALAPASALPRSGCVRA